MKEAYTKPEAYIETFEPIDIITTSSNLGDSGDIELPPIPLD